MTTLVTGGSGFVGINTVTELVKKGVDVVAAVSPSYDGQLDGSGATVFIGNLVDTAPRLPAADTVIHLASMSHVPTSIEDPAKVVRNNVSLEVAALEYARRVGVKMFIQLSTEGVYGASYTDVPEWAPILPSNPYAASKAAQEAIAISYWRTFGVPLSIVNVVNVFGPYQGADKFVPMIIGKLQRGETIQIHGQRGDDEQWVVGERAYEYVKNLVDIFDFLTINSIPPSQEESHFPARWHAAGLQRVANDDLVKMIAAQLNIEPDLEYVEAGASRPGYDACYALDGSKLKAAGWSPPYTLEEGLMETVDATRA